MNYTRGAKRTAAAASLSWPEKLRLLFTGVGMPRPENERTPADVGLAYSRVRLAGHGGAWLDAWLVLHEAPRGTVLLFHGYADAKDSLLTAAREFHDLGYSVLLVDFYGSGDSTASSTSIGYYEADDVAAAFAATRQLPLLRPIVLHGVSMGAAAVLRATDVHRLSPDALILEAPFDRLLTTVEHRFDELRAPAFPAARLLLFWGGVQQGFDALAFAPAENARGVTAPALVWVGDRDPYVSVHEAQNVVANLAGPKRLEIVPGLRHDSCLNARPGRWRRVVAEFLSAVPRPE